MMEGKFPLITAIVIHYNNGDYIYETIDSILRQDYPNMELLISDDCSPDGFDADRVISYINQHRRSNLKRVVINENHRNLGTVKHLELIRQKAQGEFELLIAADDVWYDEHVFSAFAKRFEELGASAEWLTSQIEMCDETLEKVERLFVPDHIIGLIKSENYQELLNQEIISCYLPGSGCAYRKSFFEKINNLSKDYYLIEDYTTHLRALRLGIPVYYTDIISVKHRHGGISHGNNRNGDVLYSRYIHDFLTTFEVEIEPYQSQFAEAAYRQAKKKYEYNCGTYEEALKKIRVISADGISYEAGAPLWKGVLKAAKGTVFQFSRAKRVREDARMLLWILLCAVLWRLGSGYIPYEPVRYLLQISILLTAVMISLRIGINVFLRVWEKVKRRRLR